MDNKYNLPYDAKTIEEKLSMVLPVVELETVADMSGSVNCTERDSAILNELAEKKLPVIICAKFKTGGATIDAAAVFLYANQSGNYGFKASLMGIEMTYGNVGGSWLAVMNG